MNLQFISWDDLNAIKENLDQYVSKFALPSNAWIEEELGHSPFLNTKYLMPDQHRYSWRAVKVSESIGWNIYSGLPALRYYLQQDLGEGS